MAGRNVTVEMQPPFIRIEFGRGFSKADYDKFVWDVLNMAEKMMAEKPSDCDNEIWVSGNEGSLS